MAEQIERFYKDLGKQIRLLRAKREMTQEDLAERVVPRVTRAAIANIEGGKQRVLAHTLWQLADALGVPPATLAAATPDRDKNDGRVPLHRIQGELTKKLGVSKQRPRNMTSKIERRERGGRG
ncbi:MAG: hypothetical protein A3J75_00980 [Acidobacteria bacterium RBG_16_68_9]|nr:MAG: hypothetical protein A3J75_00980 [Acidobacteria bacterium RBG_16_68_9]